jgi:hypothetical protein
MEFSGNGTLDQKHVGILYLLLQSKFWIFEHPLRYIRHLRKCFHMWYWSHRTRKNIFKRSSCLNKKLLIVPNMPNQEQYNRLMLSKIMMNHLKNNVNAITFIFTLTVYRYYEMCCFHHHHLLNERITRAYPILTVYCPSSYRNFGLLGP